MRGLMNQTFRDVFVLISVLIISCGHAERGDKAEDNTLVINNTESKPSVVHPIQTDAQEKSFTLEELLGKVEPSKDTSFVKVSTNHGSKENMYLRKEAYEQFKAMYNVAKQDGVELRIISATRSFNDQKAIWEAKWTGKRLVNGKDISDKPAKERAQIILRYSSMPGTSRHHWGTDMDLNDLNNSYFESGKGKAIYDWLKLHAGEYGFCQPYTVKDSLRPAGYEEEKWHWSYIPIAAPMLKTYVAQAGNDMISGFNGAEVAVELNVVKNYVEGINPECK